MASDQQSSAVTENLSLIQSLLEKWQTDDSHAENVDALPSLPTALPPPASPLLLQPEPVSNYGDSCFLLPHLLSADECRRLIADSEGLGFHEIPTVGADYRGCRRIISLAPQLVDDVWQRVRGLLKPIHIPAGSDPRDRHIHGVPFLLHGSWRPVGLNPVLRLCRYEPGQHFGPHYDGFLVRDARCRSLQTLMVYLNEEFDGGATNFIDERQQLHKDDAGRYCAEQENVLCSVRPRSGLAIIFNHHRLHEGEHLRSGVKYIMRTDIMFEKEGEDDISEEKRRAVELLQQAERYEAHKDMEKAVQCYRRAFKLCPELETCT